MIRRLLGLAVTGMCLLSLLASAAVGWLWWRGHRTRDAVEFQRPSGRWEVASAGGRLSLDNGPQQQLERTPLTEAELHYQLTLQGFRDREARVRQIPPGGASLEVVAAWYGKAEAGNDVLAADRRVQVERARYAATPKSAPSGWSVACPAAIAVTAAPLLAWVGEAGRRAYGRRRRRRLGLCLACGYDLRASSERCPECGAVPTSPPGRKESA